MIWRTDDGAEYCKLVEGYGRLLDSCGIEWKDICEARVIYAMPLALRPGEMGLIAKKRCAGDRDRERQIRAHLETIVTAEWKWQKAQREQRV